MTPITLNPIGIISSPYKEKFAVPRQPGLIEDGGGELRLLSPYNQPEAVRGLMAFSHIWLLFIFHQTEQAGWQPTVRPPRLGGNERVGVFATRSTFRPNPLGLSLVELKNIHCCGQDVRLILGSLDLVDGTPIVDIKPYLPFADAKPQATAGFAQEKPNATLLVTFTADARQALITYLERYPHLERFITQVIAQDPRPAYHKKQETTRCYAMHLLEFNISWQINAHNAEVFAIDVR